MKRKHVMFCHSADEMNKKADTLIAQGYKVEREMGVQSVPSMCLPIYKVVFEK